MTEIKRGNFRLTKNFLLFGYFYLVASIVLNGTVMFKDDMSFNPSPIETLWYWQHLVFSFSLNNLAVVLMSLIALLVTYTRKSSK